MSFGGFISLRAAQEHGGPFKALILIGSVFDLEAFARAREGTWDSLPYSFYFGKLDSVMPKLEARSPMQFLDKIECPVQVFHGRNDPRVSIDQALAFVEQCRSLGKDVAYESCLNTHGANGTTQLLECNQRMLEFMGDGIRKNSKNTSRPSRGS